MSLYTMKLSDSVDTMEFNLLEVPIQDKDIEGAVDNVVLSGDIYTDFLWLKKHFTHKWSILCKDDYERLRGFYTRQFSNAEVPIYQLLDAPSPVEESAGSGEYIQITTTDSTAKLASVEMLGKAEQTTYSGKNLCSRGYYESPATARFEVNKSNLQQTFTISYISDVTAGNATIYLFTDGTNRGSVGVTIQQTAGTRRSATITLDATNWGYVQNATAIRLTAYLGNAGHTTDATITQAMVENGSSMTDYEPYVGGTPAPNPDYPQPISVVTGENVVKIEGKNLWSPDNAQDFVTAVNVSSQASIETYDGRNCLRWQSHVGYGSYPTKNLTLEVKFQENTQYTISYDLLKTGARNTTLAIYYTDGTTTTSADAQTTDTWEHYTITSTAGKTIAYIAPWYTTGTSYIDIDSVQLELGSTATTYEPYQGQEFEVNLGKNLFSGFATLATGSTYADGVLTISSSSSNISNNIPVFADTAYYLKWTTANQSRVYIREYDASNTQISDTTKYSPPYSFTTSATASYVKIYFSPSTSESFPVTVTNIQLEKGSTATTYSPYFTPIELAGIGEIQPDGLPKYHDRIKKNLTTGKWYIEKQVGKVVLDGTEYWYQFDSQQTGYYRAYTTSKKWGKPNDGNFVPVDKFLSDHFQNNGGYLEEQKTYLASTGYASYVKISDTIVNTLDAWKTWLASNPTTVYYALVTPTTTEITNEALIAQLEALGASSLYLGVNNIGTETLNAMPTLALTYFPYYPHEIISPKAVRMELTDGGIINACECRENVQITLRGTIQ